jgi:hypothetical protein
MSILPGPDTDIYARRKAYDVEIESILMFQSIHNLRFDWVSRYMNAGFQVQLVIEFKEDRANLGAIAGGRYDSKLKAFAESVKRDGRQIILRPMHEFNGDWYPWGVYRSGNSVDLFKRAWRHVVDVIRKVGPRVRFQLSYNVSNAKASRTPFSSFWPGDSYVDQVCISAYNRCGTSAFHTQWKSLETVLRPAYDQIRSFTNKPMCIGETSTTSYGGNKPAWFTDAFIALAYQFPRITIVNWFFENKGRLDWDLNTRNQERAWSEGLEKFRRVTRPSGSGDENENNSENDRGGGGGVGGELIMRDSTGGIDELMREILVPDPVPLPKGGGPSFTVDSELEYDEELTPAEELTDMTTVEERGGGGNSGAGSPLVVSIP